MTKHELSQFRHLKSEIERDQSELVALLCHATSATQTITGMPFVGGASDKVGACAVKIADLRTVIEANQERCERIERYIKDIPDRLTHDIFRYRVIKGYKWKIVALKVRGNNTADSVRMIYYRYIDAHNAA
jgi:hypothetical protein